MYCSLNVVREEQGAEQVAGMGEKVQSTWGFGGETVGKEATWKIKTDLGG